MSPLEQAAVAYCAARVRNDGSEPKDWVFNAAEVDRTWHDLRTAAGFAEDTE